MFYSELIFITLSSSAKKTNTFLQRAFFIPPHITFIQVCWRSGGASPVSQRALMSIIPSTFDLHSVQLYFVPCRTKVFFNLLIFWDHFLRGELLLICVARLITIGAPGHNIIPDLQSLEVPCLSALDSHALLPHPRATAVLLDSESHKLYTRFSHVLANIQGVDMRDPCLSHRLCLLVTGGLVSVRVLY